MYTIYTQDLCGYCTAAKRLMQEHNLKYKEINISEKVRQEIQFMEIDVNTGLIH